MYRVVTLALALAVSAPWVSSAAHAQTPPLERLLAEADAESPRITAARSTAEAAAARVPQAGAHPDPTLGFSFMNVPLSSPEFGKDPMTMTQVLLSTRLPWPGKLGLQEDVAELFAEASDAEVERVRQEVRSEVKTAYYELYFIDRAVEVTARNRGLLDDFAQLTTVQYAVGGGRQPEALRAQVERTRLDDQLVALRERRRSVEARLNAVIGRSTEVEVPTEAVGLPARVEQAALEPAAARLTFSSPVLAGPEEEMDMGGPIPSVAELQRLALERSPMIQAHTRRVAAEERTLALSSKAKLPDFNVAVGYSQRSDHRDFFQVSVSAPLPIFAGRKQNQGVREQNAVVQEHHARHGTMVNQINGEVASLAAELRRAREQIVLLNQGILPQARTGLASATASYRVGSVDFLTLLDAQVTLFRHELEYHRLLADFASGVAELERVVGTEVLR